MIVNPTKVADDEHKYSKAVTTPLALVNRIMKEKLSFDSVYIHEEVKSKKTAIYIYSI